MHSEGALSIAKLGMVLLEKQAVKFCRSRESRQAKGRSRGLIHKLAACEIETVVDHLTTPSARLDCGSDPVFCTTYSVNQDATQLLDLQEYLLKFERSLTSCPSSESFTNSASCERHDHISTASKTTERLLLGIRRVLKFRMKLR
jgi:hypothetical protein